MILIIKDEQTHLHYAAMTPQAELIYEERIPYPDGDRPAQIIERIFVDNLLAKIRTRGKMFTHIGLILPFASPAYTGPEVLTHQLLKKIQTGFGVFESVFEPNRLIASQIFKHWPHLTHVALFDTCLSDKLERYVSLVPFSYEVVKKYSIKPYLLQSYAHKAAMLSEPKGDWISIYLGPVTSIAAFTHGELVDAVPAYSPFGSIYGLNTSGAVDPGLSMYLGQALRPQIVRDIFESKSGINAVAEISESFDELINIAGMGNEKRDPTKYSIETIEWVELAIQQYIKEVRHQIGALLTSVRGPVSLYISGPYGRPEFPLMKRILAFPLDSMSVKTTKYTDLQTACLDVAGFNTK